MYSFSICIIAKNEEKNIAKCLDSVTNVSDDIILVDTGSTDDTINIARKYTTHVFNYTWNNDFSAARNFSISQASNDLVLILDCDEYISEINKKTIIDSFKNASNQIGLIRCVNLREDCSTKGAYTDYIPRFFNKQFFRYQGSIHEQIVSSINTPDKPIGIRLPLTIIHSGYIPAEVASKNKHARNLSMLLDAIKLYPQDCYLHFQIGQEYYNQGLYSSAIPHYQFVINNSPLNPYSEFHRLTLMSLSDCFFKLNDIDNSLFIEKYTDTFGNNPDFHFLLGQIYYKKNNPLKAMQEFLIATTMNNAHIEGTNTYLSWYYMGLINESLGKTESAITFYQKCSDYQPAIERIINLT